MAVTYEPIASTTLGSSATSVTLSSIPSTYTDLVVVIYGTTVTSTADLAIQYNADTATNYSYTSLHGNGTAAGSARGSSTANPLLNYYSGISTTTPSTIVVQIMSYANTNVYKTALASGARAGGGVDRNVILWRSTSAINEVKIVVQSSLSFASGSAVSLYGIKAA